MGALWNGRFLGQQHCPTLYHGVLSWCRSTEPYMLQRVSRQYGRMQAIPKDPIEPLRAKRPVYTKRHKIEYDTTRWAWENLAAHMASLFHMGNPTTYGDECTEDYMAWYIPRTHPIIGRPDNDSLQQVSIRYINYLSICMLKPSNSYEY